MRTKLVVGNWKMNLTIAEATATVEACVKLVDTRVETDVVVCPAYLAIAKVRELLRNTHIKIGAQDVFWADKGAFTGNISAAMLRDAGVTYCIVGHSETRGRFGKLEIPASTLGYFCESDETISLKICALLYQSITPILCVGETLEEREQGRTDEVIEAQLRGALDGVEPAELYGFVIAYEPVWAIGTGEVCGADEANRVCGEITKMLSRIADAEVADQIRILYGGSVKASNAKELFRQPNIDGGLVGGASLDPDEFARIVASA